MNRTDRLYALVEDLRAVAPGRRSARRLAERYEVSVRTIERDIGALQQAGVPIYADLGRRGGYTLDPAMTLPPLNFTPAEAVAVSVALRGAGGSPFAREARSALRKIMAAMPARQASAAHDLAERVRFLAGPDDGEPAGIPLVIENALAAKRVLRIDYVDKHGVPSVEHRLLSESLYRQIGFNQPISDDLFDAIAKILADSYRLSGESLVRRAA